MKRLFRIYDEAELDNVEDLLQDVFEPVSPRRDYVKDLNRRLSNFPSPSTLTISTEYPRMSGRPLISMVWSLVGLASGLILVVLGLRIIILLVSSLRAIYQRQI